ncbi:MAG: hypothetical protein NUV57_06310, partial [archaeon]|nr:hypothetical protein [archaeon]
MNKFVATVLILTLLTGIAFAGTTTGSITTPSSPTKGIVSITFTALNTTSNNLLADLIYNINDTNTPIVSNLDLLGDYNNSNPQTNLDCTGSSPDSNSFSCSYSWNTTGIDSNNLLLILKGFENGSSNKKVFYTSPIIVDNTLPTANFIQPNDSNNTYYKSNNVIFDVNDSGSGVSTVTVTGLTSSFSLASNCTQNGKNYHCDYTETGFDTNNTIYTMNINVTDVTGNSSSPAITKPVTYIDNTAPVQVTGFS